MRIVFATLITLLFGLPSAQAATYEINLNDLAVVGYAAGPCYCGGGPIYQFIPFAPGSVINFGSVTISSVFDDHSYERGGSVGPKELSNYQGAPIVGFNPDDFLSPNGSTGAPLGSSETFSLIYTIPSYGSGIQIAWDGPGIYTPPGQIAAVPEPSTWAMTILGFAAVGLMAYRGKRNRPTLRPRRSEP
jgi:hypothetical protein